LFLFERIIERFWDLPSPSRRGYHILDRKDIYL
jgi:hypothetical protein